MNPESNSKIIDEVAQIIINAIDLSDVDAKELGPETLLGQAPFELDSIEILEVIAAIENHYGVKVADANEGAKYFQSLGSIAEFVSLKAGNA